MLCPHGGGQAKGAAESDGALADKLARRTSAAAAGAAGRGAANPGSTALDLGVPMARSAVARGPADAVRAEHYGRRPSGHVCGAWLARWRTLVWIAVLGVIAVLGAADSPMSPLSVSV